MTSALTSWFWPLMSRNVPYCTLSAIASAALAKNEVLTPGSISTSPERASTGTAMVSSSSFRHIQGLNQKLGSDKSSRLLFEHLFNISPQIWYFQNLCKGFDPMLDAVNIQVRMRVNDGLNINQVLWTMSNCLHDDQIFRCR